MSYQILYQNVLLESKQYLVMIRFLIFMSKLTFLIFSNFRHCFIKHLRQKRHLLNMFSRKCQVQNDRINWKKISCFCQKLDLTLYFTIKTSIFKLRPLFRFLCLINSFYRRYVSCIYTVSYTHLTLPTICSV